MSDERRAGVGCGAAIVSDGQVLLVKRRRPPEAGRWNLPGGKVGYLERVEDAIRREVLEETGLSIRFARLLQVTQMLGQDGQHWVSPVWLADVREATLSFADFDAADEIFVVGNYGKVTPVRRIEARDLQPGPFFRRARELYWAFARSG
jgi:ADP-ribose pyrophosphatase YjhB (NUDIX family)